MSCEEIRAEFVEAVLGGPEAVSPRVMEHMQACDGCAEEFASYRQTMSLLDEWQAPEPSPYFSSRLRARIREQAAAAPARGWLAWVRRPVIATAAALLIAVGASLLETAPWQRHQAAANTRVTASAVSDLQYLDKNADLFSDFDALDGQTQTE